MQRRRLLSGNARERKVSSAIPCTGCNGSSKRWAATAKCKQANCWSSLGNKFNLVCTDTLGKNLVRRTVVKHFKAVIERANIPPDVRFHDLRHSFAVTSLYSGDDVKTVQANLGHATAQFTLDVYGHVTQKMRQESAMRMQAFYNHLEV